MGALTEGAQCTKGTKFTKVTEKGNPKIQTGALKYKEFKLKACLRLEHFLYQVVMFGIYFCIKWWHPGRKWALFIGGQRARWMADGGRKGGGVENGSKDKQGI